ncbi:MAG: 5-formyltetrahydrofolate cyclo-ligase, partial [Candidatus Binataceae bacterium]
MAEAKSRLRKILRQSRAALDDSAVRSRSREIERHVLQWDAYRHARAVVLYASKDNEVLTEGILADSLKS